MPERMKKTDMTGGHHDEMADPDRTTAWQFLRWFTAQRNRAQLAVIAVSVTTSILFLVAVTVSLAWNLPAWEKAVCAGAEIVLYFAFGWQVLGSRRVQQWITGHA
jgi:protein-S-isoprenylcysteine O-methyltransferase Ste14